MRDKFKAVTARILRNLPWPFYRNGAFYIVSYIALAVLVLPHSGLPPLTQGILVTPLYHLIPMGVGLMLIGALRGRRNHVLPRPLIIVLAYLVGLVVITGLFVARERQGILGEDPLPLAMCCVLGALFGFVRSPSLLEFDAGFRKGAMLFLFVAIPIFLFRYTIKFGVFSEFPITDLFQAAHPMKGAMEFARFDVLNIFTTDSYLPVQQVMTGLLVRFFDFDPLLGEWLYPFSAEVLRFLTFFALTSALIRNELSRNFALALCLVFVTTFNPTNGDLASIGSVLLLAVLASRSSTEQGARGIFLVFSSLVIVIVLSRYAVRLDPMLFVVLLAAAAITIPIFERAGPLFATVAASGVLALSSVALHRSALLFVPGVIVVAAVIALLPKIANRDLAKYVPFAAILLPALAGILASWILIGVIEGDYKDPPWLIGFYDVLIGLVLGITVFSPEILLGLGGKVALFELGRELSLVLAALACALFLFAWIFSLRRVSRAKPGRGPPLFKGFEASIMAMWIAAWMVILLVLAGFPYAHRIGFLPAVLLALIFAELFVSDSSRTTPVISSAIVAVLTFFLIHLVRPGGGLPWGGLEGHNFVELIQPGVTVMGLIVASAAVLTLWFKRSHTRLAMALSAVIVVVAVAWERQLNEVYFMHYQYGKDVAEFAHGVTHYSELDLALADSLMERPEGVVLVSDPHTLNILRARTGLNSIVSFSNLDTMQKKYSEELKSVLRNLVERSNSLDEKMACRSLVSLLSNGFAPEYNYWLMRKLKPDRDTLMAALNYSEGLAVMALPAIRGHAVAGHKWIVDYANQNTLRFAVVINEKTLAWIDLPPGSTLPYYPMNGRMEEAMVTSLVQNLHGSNVGRRAVVLDVACHGKDT